MSNYGTFGENNPVWRAINRYADMLLTGVLFIITCLPVVTIGASLCAFYYTAMDSLRKEDGYIFKRYFRSFGKNFKKATILWLIMLAIGAILGLDVYFWLVNSEMQFSGVMLGISGILCLLWFITFIFVFPLQARFENPVGKTLQNAFLIGLSRLPFSIGILVLFGIIGFLCISSVIIGAFVLFLGIGAIGYLLVYNYERLFKKCGYIAEDDGKIKNDDYDFEVEVDFDELHRQEEEAREAENDESAAVQTIESEETETEGAAEAEKTETAEAAEQQAEAKQTGTEEVTESDGATQE